jgi:hypothetical protein
LLNGKKALKTEQNKAKYGIIGARFLNKIEKKACTWGEEMYQRVMEGQQRLEIPFGVKLEADNRWVKLSSIMPWDKIDERYAENFKSEKGEVAKSGRLAFAALYIQNRLVITDEETVEQIRETPAMQYFCGFGSYTTKKPFDSSLMVHFRKRITAEMMKEITEEAFAQEARQIAENEKDNKDDDNNNDGNGEAPKGKLLLDATCCPSDIRYPTDVNLLNHARELTQIIIDKLHKQLTDNGVIKPRTYTEAARKAYLDFIKKRKRSQKEIRYAIRKQLQFVRRNLKLITKQAEQGASLLKLSNELYKKLQVISELYTQQKQMYDQNTNRCDNRIVSISQPHLRPIVRGKERNKVEFGAKAAIALVGGFSFIINLGYDNFSEGKYLEAAAEEYKRMFGFYPKVIIGDKAYTTNGNREYCNSKGIRLSGLKRGRKTEEIKEAERKELYNDNCKRNAIEGHFGNGKRKYGLDLIMTKLFDTTLTAISFGFFVTNMERLLRLFVLFFFASMEDYVKAARYRLALAC